MRITLVTIAAACHAINAAFCEANGDTSQPTWGEAPEWQRNSAINGVALHVTDPHMSPAASHESWLAQKMREGWSYGEKKDPIAKTHPCFVPYDELPPAQKAKDYLFKATVAQFVPFLPGSELAAAAELAQAFLQEHIAPIPAAHSDEEASRQQLADENRRLTAMEDEEERAKNDLEKLLAAEPTRNPRESAAKFAERHTKWQEQCEAAHLAATTNSAENTTDAPEVEKATASA